MRRHYHPQQDQCQYLPAAIPAYRDDCLLRNAATAHLPGWTPEYAALLLQQRHRTHRRIRSQHPCLRASSSFSPSALPAHRNGLYKSPVRSPEGGIPPESWVLQRGQHFHDRESCLTPPVSYANFYSSPLLFYHRIRFLSTKTILNIGAFAPMFSS